MILVSACLVGACTRYDGGSRPSGHVLGLVPHKKLVPVCPEQLGGLSTPRPPAEITPGKDGFDVICGRAGVVTRDGQTDVTRAFLLGARECVRIARLLGVESCLLKSGSPSCGVSGITGVAAAMLVLADFQVDEV